MGCCFPRCDSGNKCYMYMYVFILVLHPLIDFMYSAMIAFRIWSVDRASRKYRESKSTLKPVLAVVVESGAIYSTSLTILLVIYLSHSWTYLSWPQVVGSFRKLHQSQLLMDLYRYPQPLWDFARLHLFDRFTNLIYRELCSAWSLYGWASSWLGKMIARTVLSWRVSDSIGKWRQLNLRVSQS